MEKLYNVDEVAEILRIHKETVLRFCRESKIKASKIGREYRIKESDLKAYIDLSTNKLA